MNTLQVSKAKTKACHFYVESTSGRTQLWLNNLTVKFLFKLVAPTQFKASMVCGRSTPACT